MNQLKSILDLNCQLSKNEPLMLAICNQYNRNVIDSTLVLTPQSSNGPARKNHKVLLLSRKNNEKEQIKRETTAAMKTVNDQWYQALSNILRDNS